MAKQMSEAMAERTYGPLATPEEMGRTVGEIAEEALPEGTAWDSALPGDWVDGIIREFGVSPVGHFVWAYGPPLEGGPFPITARGRTLARVALFRAGYR